MKTNFLMLVGVFIILFGGTCFAEPSSVNTNNISESQNEKPWSAPVEEPIISEYHDKFLCDNGTIFNNQGVDFATIVGEPVKVVSDGTVISASYFGGYRLMVLIDHKDQLATLYSNLYKTEVSLGQKVKAEEVIGYARQNLHFEVRFNGSPRNPRNYLRIPEVKHWSSPVEEPIISEFGPRKDRTGGVIFNSGVDFSAEKGEPVKVVADGVVSYTGCFEDYGLTVIIDHGDGLETVYANCAQILVGQGEKVKAGEVICFAGQGLHFTVIVKGHCVNPRNYLTKIENN